MMPDSQTLFQKIPSASLKAPWIRLHRMNGNGLSIARVARQGCILNDIIGFLLQVLPYHLLQFQESVLTDLNIHLWLF